MWVLRTPVAQGNLGGESGKVRVSSSSWVLYLLEEISLTPQAQGSRKETFHKEDP